MDKMKLFDKIKLDRETSKEICFSTNEIEFVKSYKQASSGSSYVVDFKLKLKPSQDNFIKVFYLPSEDTKECIPHIFKGVHNFLKDLYADNISIKGFDIEISDCIVHPVDFKPFRYEIFTMIALHRLSFYRGRKTVTKNEDNVKIIESNSLSVFLRDSEDYSSHYENYIVKKIHLPNRGFKSISLSHNYDLKWKYEETVTDIKIFNNSTIRHDNYISIHTLNDINSIKIFNSVIEEVLMFKTDIYSKNIDIKGFDLFIGNSNLVYGTKSLKEYLYWSLLSLLR